MTIDLTQIEHSLIGLAATVIGIFGSWALARVAQKFGIDVSAGQKAAWDQALHDSLTYGVTAAEIEIKVKGWDSVEVKNQVVRIGLEYLISRFPSAVRSAGLSTDMSDPANIAKIESALQRVLPSAMLVAAASPATPPAPDAGQSVTTSIRAASE